MKSSIRILEATTAFLTAREEDPEGELANAVAESTRLRDGFHGIRALLIDLPENLAAKYAVITSIVQESFITLGASFRGLVENFRAALNKSVRKKFRISRIDAQLHANTAIDGINFSFFPNMQHRKMRSSECKNLFVLAGDTKVVKQYTFFFI